VTYKVCIDAVDGEHFFTAGGPDKALLLVFLTQHDHEGSSVTLEWIDETAVHMPPIGGIVLDPEVVYRILSGQDAP
jgi:hypothetical protein